LASEHPVGVWDARRRAKTAGREREESGVGKIIGGGVRQRAPTILRRRAESRPRCNEPAGCMGEQPQRRGAWISKSRSAAVPSVDATAKKLQLLPTSLARKVKNRSCPSACSCVSTFEALIGPVALLIAVSIDRQSTQCRRHDNGRSRDPPANKSVGRWVT